MKGWFGSLNGALGLSAIALLTELWRGFLDAMFVLPNDFGDEGTMQMAALIFVALFAVWGWSLFSAWQGGRRGLVAAFAINALVLVAIPVSWLFFYCPAECRATAGIFNLANTLNLVFGLLAGAALGLQLQRGVRRKAYAGIDPR